EACRPSLRYGVPALKPAVPFSTTKAEMPLAPLVGSVRAITTASAPTDALVMNALLPFSTYAPSRRCARVRSAAASEPEPGSVSPHAPRISPRARRGSHFVFCAGDAKRLTWFVHSELCAHIVMPTEASP